MYCRICGKSGGGSENPLNTLLCGHSFHAECLQGDECPICANKDTDCAICLEPMRENENLTLLDGCMHMFHSSCIIPHFRQPGSHGQCPMCRRNPFQENFNDEDDFDDVSDDTWQALQRIKQIEKTRVPKKQKDKIDSGLKAAREALKKARELKKKEKNSRKFSKMRQDLKDAQKASREQGKKVKTLKSAIRKVENLDKRKRNSLFMKNWRAKKDKIRLGSKADPQWQYLQADGEWSEKLDRDTLKELALDDIITDETLIRHAELPEEVEWKKIKHYI